MIFMHSKVFTIFQMSVYISAIHKYFFRIIRQCMIWFMFSVILNLLSILSKKVGLFRKRYLPMKDIKLIQLEILNYF